MNKNKEWKEYLSGEIHTDWRKQLKEGCESNDLPESRFLNIRNSDITRYRGNTLLGRASAKRSSMNHSQGMKK